MSEKYCYNEQNEVKQILQEIFKITGASEYNITNYKDTIFKKIDIPKLKRIEDVEKINGSKLDYLIAAISIDECNLRNNECSIQAAVDEGLSLFDYLSEDTGNVIIEKFQNPDQKAYNNAFTRDAEYDPVVLFNDTDQDKGYKTCFKNIRLEKIKNKYDNNGVTIIAECSDQDKPDIKLSLVDFYAKLYSGEVMTEDEARLILMTNELLSMYKYIDNLPLSGF